MNERSYVNSHGYWEDFYHPTKEKMGLSATICLFLLCVIIAPINWFSDLKTKQQPVFRSLKITGILLTLPISLISVILVALMLLVSSLTELGTYLAKKITGETSN